MGRRLTAALDAEQTCERMRPPAEPWAPFVPSAYLTNAQATAMLGGAEPWVPAVAGGAVAGRSDATPEGLRLIPLLRGSPKLPAHRPWPATPSSPAAGIEGPLRNQRGPPPIAVFSP